MVARFGLDRPQRQSSRPRERLVDHLPTLDAFQLRRDGLMAEGATWTVEIPPDHSLRLARAPGKILIGDQEIEVRSHPTLLVEMFGSPTEGCGRNCYRLHYVEGRWRCRLDPPRLKYRSQCRDRGVPGLARLAWLRKRIGASPLPFSPIEPRRGYAPRHWRLAREIRELEERLVEHLRVDVGDVLEKRLHAGRRRGR
jgi:hypothetical protein